MISQDIALVVMFLLLAVLFLRRWLGKYKKMRVAMIEQQLAKEKKNQQLAKEKKRSKRKASRS